MVNHNNTVGLDMKLDSTDGRFWFTALLSPLPLFMATSVSCRVDTITAKKAHNHFVYNPKQMSRNYRRRLLSRSWHLLFVLLICQWTSSLSISVKMTNNMKLKNINNHRKWRKTQESPPSHMKHMYCVWSDYFVMLNYAAAAAAAAGQHLKTCLCSSGFVLPVS